jgi:hypothetical protein
MRRGPGRPGEGHPAAAVPRRLAGEARFRSTVVSDKGVDSGSQRGKPRDLAAGQRAPDNLTEHPGEPPIVARLVIEIRSDGSRTIARGAMEDALSGQKVAVEATGTTPLALALSLAKNIVATPLLARQAFRALVRRNR